MIVSFLQILFSNFFFQGLLRTVLFNWKCGRNSETSHHLHCFLFYTWYIWTVNTWLSGMPFVVLTQHKGCWSWAASSGKSAEWGALPWAVWWGWKDQRPLAPQDQHPVLCTLGLHWTAAFLGSAFISSLGASSIADGPGKNKVSSWFWVFF